MDSYDPYPFPYPIQYSLAFRPLSNGPYANANATWQLPVTCRPLGWWQEFVARRKNKPLKSIGPAIGHAKLTAINWH